MKKYQIATLFYVIALLNVSENSALWRKTPRSGFQVLMKRWPFTRQLSLKSPKRHLFRSYFSKSSQPTLLSRLKTWSRSPWAKRTYIGGGVLAGGAAGYVTGYETKAREYIVAKANEDLQQALFRKNLAEIMTAIKSGADVNSRGQDGETPLSIAIKQNNLEAVTFLLDNNARVNDMINGESPLFIAIDMYLQKLDKRERD